MRSRRQAWIVVGLLLPAAIALAGAPPRGKRTARPKPTHLVVSEAAIDVGGPPGSLLAGVPVTDTAGRAAKGKVKVTVIGGVEVSGTVDGAKLGLRVAKDTALMTEGGKERLGTAHPGALVRVVGAGKAGRSVVEIASTFPLRAEIADADLTAEPGELVLTVAWNQETAKATDLYATQKLDGKPVLRLPEGVHLEYFEQAGDVAHVRTVDGFEIEGWTPLANLRERQAAAAQAPDARLIQPTHEAFVDAPLYADAAGKKKIGTLHGGALVEVNGRATRDAGDVAKTAATVKVTTPGQVVVEGWMHEADLRELSQKAMTQ
jgi:hypothetical protein